VIVGEVNTYLLLDRISQFYVQLWILFVNDSEYIRSAGVKPVLSLSCIYLVSPGTLLLLLLRQLRTFAAAAVLPYPTRRSDFL